MILVVSHADDDHLAPLLAELARIGADSVVFDTSTIPTESAITADYGGTSDQWRVRFPDGRVLDLGACRAGWWRRALPSRGDPRITDPQQAAWAANECYEATSGFWDALPVTWVSPPRAIEQTMMKTWQLPAARTAGLRVPRTVVTNDPDEARRFVEEAGVGKIICKAFSATMANWRETRLVGDAEIAVLDRVSTAPVIFQEFVPAEFDVRATVVGEQVFAAAIFSQELPYPLDFRLYLESVRMEPVTLPEEVQRGLRSLLSLGGLLYGAVDLRRTPDGDYVFLEINPAGQWRFVEEATGLPITAAMGRLLADLDVA